MELEVGTIAPAPRHATVFHRISMDWIVITRLYGRAGTRIFIIEQ